MAGAACSVASKTPRTLAGLPALPVPILILTLPRAPPRHAFHHPAGCVLRGQAEKAAAKPRASAVVEKRVARQAAYGAAATDMEKWEGTIKAGRAAETLDLRDKVIQTKQTARQVGWRTALLF